MPRNPEKLYRHDRLLAKTLLPLVPAFVAPNHITVLRFLSIPFVAYFLIVHNYAVAIPLFILAGLSDALDGTLARVRHQITRWGTFYDPVADKLLIGSTVLIVVTNVLGPWFAAALIVPEVLIISGGFLFRMHKSHKMQSANAWGKAKMFSQVVGLSVLLFGDAFSFSPFVTGAEVILSVSIFCAICSLFTYGL